MFSIPFLPNDLHYTNLSTVFFVISHSGFPETSKPSRWHKFAPLGTTQLSLEVSFPS